MCLDCNDEPASRDLISNDRALEELRAKLSGDAPPKAGVLAELNWLTDTITVFDDYLYQLAQKLQPVLNDSDDSEGVPPDTATNSADAPLTITLRNQRLRLEAAQRRLIEILERIAF